MPNYSPKWTKDEAVAHLRAADPRLAAMMDRVGTCKFKVRRDHSLYEMLFRAIVYQQLAGKAAGSILNKVCLLYNPEPIKRNKQGYWGVPTCYPQPEEIMRTPDHLLRGAGLSRNKLASIRDLAAKTLDGTVPSRRAAHYMTDEELIERLTTIRGIGRWTVEMLLIFGLGRADILPVDDYGVRKGFALTYSKKDLPKPKELMKLGEKWRPYRSIASWYFWRAVELPGAKAPKEKSAVKIKSAAKMPLPTKAKSAQAARS
jgi:3-methyladenine DNA glycosylase/8-oxoguanine DNA glycosylase